MVEFCSSNSQPCPASTNMVFSFKSSFTNPAYIKSVTDSMTVTTYTPDETGKYD